MLYTTRYSAYKLQCQFVALCRAFAIRACNTILRSQRTALLESTYILFGTTFAVALSGEATELRVALNRYTNIARGIGYTMHLQKKNKIFFQCIKIARN